ncbi:hypothetical protein QJS10_CPB19g01921 [Acorus calamus]|uniref:Uncharacterized protein n=1 Tax=Acorus calamus TaxID=4465 RepID=A0AAV9CHB3_ACOCL|nr:hypothetical protein QJS10_CPB19g01921 [Acorus calamus]
MRSRHRDCVVTCQLVHLAGLSHVVTCGPGRQAGSPSQILNWVQSKLGGGHEKKRVDDAGFTHHVLQETCKEEFSDWPQGLLAIGTFGNTEIEEPNVAAAITTAEPEMSDFTLEDATQLQKELTKVLARKPVMSDDDGSQGEKLRPNNLLPLDKFLNCPSSLEVDRIDRARLDSSSQNMDGDPPRNGGGVVLSKGRDGVGDERSLIRRRSVSFLLKKVFACRSGFETVPASLRDPTPLEPRMERLMRALLHKKIYPQSSSPRSGGKKYLEGKATEDKTTPRSSSDGSKWVRTDSESREFLKQRGVDVDPD